MDDTNCKPFNDLLLNHPHLPPATMACQTCRHARHLARSLRSSTDRHLSSSSFSTYSGPVTASAALPTRRRHLTHSAHHRGISGSSTSRPTSRSSAPSNAATTETPSDAPPAGSASAALRNVGSRLAAYQAISSPYALTSSLDKLYKRCASPAAYTISEELRKKDEVPKTAEGEELGTPEGPWLESESSLFVFFFPFPFPFLFFFFFFCW